MPVRLRGYPEIPQTGLYRSAAIYSSLIASYPRNLSQLRGTPARAPIEEGRAAAGRTRVPGGGGGALACRPKVRWLGWTEARPRRGDSRGVRFRPCLDGAPLASSVLSGVFPDHRSRLWQLASATDFARSMPITAVASNVSSSPHRPAKLPVEWSAVHDINCGHFENHRTRSAQLDSRAPSLCRSARCA